MAISTTPEYGPKAWEARSGPKVWEKNISDVSHDVEAILKARDIGIARINYSRLNVVAELSKEDKYDYYKFNAISRGPLRITVRDSGKTENEAGPLDLDVNKYLKAAGFEVEEDKAEETKSEFDRILEALKLKNIRVEVISYENRKEKVLADSAAETTSTEFENFAKLTDGEYRVRNPQMFYIRVSRLDEKKLTDEHQYALQVQIGTEHKHDYMSIEKKPAKSTEYAGKRGKYISSKANLALDNAVQLSSASILSSQAATNMLSDGLYNISSILNPSKINLFG